MPQEDNKLIWRVAVMVDKVIHTLLTKNITLTGNPNHTATLRRGIERFSTIYNYQGVANDRIVDFVVYQLYRYRDMIADYPHNRWQLSWCFSDNAVDKYRRQFIAEEGKAGMNYYIDQWLRQGSLDRQSLTDMLAEPGQHRLAKYIYMESEEMTKKRFLNTEMGLMLCIQSTTGWSPKSPTCQKCNNTSRCLEVSARKFPELIRLRQQVINP